MTDGARRDAIALGPERAAALVRAAADGACSGYHKTVALEAAARQMAALEAATPRGPIQRGGGMSGFGRELRRRVLAMDAAAWCDLLHALTFGAGPTLDSDRAALFRALGVGATEDPVPTPRA